MKKQNSLIKRMVVVLLVFLITIFIAPEVSAESTIKLIVDGQDITSIVAPRIVNDRTLVPIRMVAEQLGAQVNWNDNDRTVDIKKGNNNILLRIDSYLIESSVNNDLKYLLSDVPAQIFTDRTFVPLRVVSNALGVSIEWDDATRTVFVDSNKTSNISPFFDIKISSVNNGQVITGTTTLQSLIPSKVPEGAKEIKYLLLDKSSAKGFIIAQGTNFDATYEWKPSTEDNGEKILVSAIYDKDGKFIAGDAMPVSVNVNPVVVLKGITENQTVQTATPLRAELNFNAAYVVYEMINRVTGDIYLSPKWDPDGEFTMIPYMEDAGGLAIRVIAYDIYDKPYSSETINININVTPQLSLKGITNWQTIDKPVTLWASTNFIVNGIEYVAKDNETGSENILAKVAYGGFTWFPRPDESGNKELFVRIKDMSGKVYTSEPVYVTVSGAPKVLIQGTGPNQVITDNINLKVISNIVLDNIRIKLINPKTGEEKIIAEGKDLADFTYTPISADEGNRVIKAEGIYSNSKIETEEIPVRFYLKKVYGPKPIIEKSQFLDFASELSVKTYKETGMSAALQTAQAILETGWGQSVPVDKYTGQFSNNLFGIKGIGTAGSVTSNTWEEYNGVVYRIDDDFRAYNNVQESWDDHSNLLLLRDRYKPFRNVMNDRIQGAWALKRAGYATDSQYPIKLINIMNQYNLKKLDELGI